MFSPNGITAHARSANDIVTTGASINIILLEPAGITISLNMYFKASATVWSKPKGPTTFGPLLSCTKPQTLRSTQTIIATAINTGMTKDKIFKLSKKIIFKYSLSMFFRH